MELGGIVEQDETRTGEADSGSAAFEKPDAEFFFEGFDLLGYGGLGEVERFACFAEAEMLGDGAEDGEAEILEH